MSAARTSLDATAVTVASLVYQGAIVAFASYLAWFWLLTKYLAARLSVFSFLTPLFGVLAGVLVLGEPLTPIFVCGAVLVGAGIVLVNRRRT
jgi:drug/metabolite transporter (DMT)-like permease